MNATKLLTALMAMLVVSAGAGAVSAASIDAETTTVDAEYSDGTVTLTVLDNDTGVENVSVETDNFTGETDANGTVAFDTNETELSVEFTKDNTTFERSYVIDDGTISEAEDVEEEPMLNASASLDNWTVTVDVDQNGSAAENVSVTANGDEQGMTDANGTLSFGIDNETEELTLVFEKDNMSLTQEYVVEDGELVNADDDEGDDEELSANENASERAHNVLAVIQQYLTDGSQENLGQMIQDALGDDRGNSENAKQNGNADKANNGQQNGNADEATNGKQNGNADKANNGQKDDKADKKGHNGNGHADDDEDDEDDEEEEDDDEETDSDE